MRRSTKAKSVRPAENTPEPLASMREKDLKSETAKIPHDPINEQVILAACVQSRATRTKLVRVLHPDGFYGRGHKAAWEGLVELERRGLDYDPATMRQITGDKADTAYVDALVASRPGVPTNLAHHVECWLWDHRRVQTAKGPVSELIELLQDPTTDPDTIRRVARRLGSAFDGSSTLRFLRDPEAVLADLERDIDESVERNRRGAVVAHPYGLPDFDVKADGEPRIVPGMAPAGMTLLVGQSGHGKTTLMNQIGIAQIERGRRVLHGAWEQKDNVNLRMLAGFRLGLPRARVATGKLSDEERDMLKCEARRLVGGERPMIRFFELPFDQSRGNREKNVRLLNETNLDTIHEHVEFSGCDVAFFDLFHQALVETKPDDEKRALDRMQAIAKHTRAHLVLVHHVNKADLASRADQRPTRAAIKGGTHWINAPDTILAPHIPGKVKSIPMDTLEVHVLKQRDGEWPICVEFDYEPRTGIVTNGRDMVLDQDEGTKGGLGGWLAADAAERRGGR